MVGTDAGEDLAVRLRDGLGPDLRDLEVDEVRGDQDGCLDRRTDRHDGDLEVLGADLPEGVDVLGIGLHGVGDAVRPLLHELEVVVDREHLAVETVEFARAGGTEPAETDDEDGSVAPEDFNQRSAFPRAVSSTAFAMSRRPPRRESLYQRAP